MKTLIIIPAFQVAPYLQDVISETKKYINDLLVIDDGSTDGTGDIARKCDVLVATHDTNRGKGAALKTGFIYAQEHNYEAVITLDGDGQHNPKYIPLFLKRYDKTRAGIIIGSRKHDRADMSYPRRCSNFLTSHILSALLNRKIEDSQSGYRMILVSLLRQLKLKSDHYQMETEILIKAVENGYRIDFIPIKVIYGRNFPSSIKHFTDTFRWIKMVLEEI